MSNLDIRQSQLVMSSGVGGIIDFPRDSLMLAGLDQWPYVTNPRSEELKKHYRILDSRLQRRLSQKLNRPINSILKPIEAPPAGIRDEEKHLYHQMPFIRFPTWYWCPRCNLLHQLAFNTPAGAKELFCEGIHATRFLSACTTIKGNGPRKGKIRLLPARFVVACEAGHIDDFPYLTFIKHKPSCEAGTGDIFMTATGGLGLGGVKLTCAKCSSYRLMRDALSSDNLVEAMEAGCTARRPWLPNDEYGPPCEESPRLAQKGSVNLYSAKYESAIYIPDKARHIEEKLMVPDLKGLIDDAYDLETDSFDEPTLKFLVNRTNIPQEDIQDFLKQRLRAKPTGQNPADFLYEEYTAFLNPLPDNKTDDFDPFVMDINCYSPEFTRYFDRVVLLRKLRETRVFTGFSRLGGALETPPISKKNLNWLPGIEVRGEGIFLQFRADRLQEWEAQLDSEVLRQIQRLQPPNASPAHRYVLIHTLAHLLIRQLSFDCGYSSTALRERLYVGSGDDWQMHGLLIYTASGDSEGTMGGLVRLGRPGNLEPCWKTAITMAEVCSNDPLCIESNGQGFKNRNLAACHACALIPETACETGNQYLDRSLVIGDPIHERKGFFDLPTKL